jgi:RimJ/RimL family protein N-acetyltransferase
MKLRRVTEKDAAFLYRLLKERPPEANISHRKMPTMAQHVAFIRSDPYTWWYILEDVDGQKCGSIYLTDYDEIGISIAREHQRQGLARWAVQTLMKTHKRQRYLANVAPKNVMSHALFAAMGFQCIQYTYELRP